MTVVVDASIALKWFVPESLREEAMDILRAEEHIAAPDLLIPELAGLVLEKIKRNEITSLQAETILSGLQSSGLNLIPAAGIFSRAVEIARTLDLSVYRCFYVAAAEQLDTTFVTADLKFCAAARHTGFDGIVQALAA